jgi:hypothetical protein
MDKSLHLNLKIPIDTSRFFLELKKFNRETLLKIFFSPFYRDLVEIKSKKGLISLISPYVSGVIEIFEKNSQNIFHSLFKSFFIDKCHKKELVENFILTGASFLRHLQLTIFINRNLKIKKDKKIFRIFFNSNHEIENEVDPKNLKFIYVSGIKFFMYVKFVLIEVDSLFLKENLFFIQWKIQFFKFLNKFEKINNQKKYLLISNRIKKILTSKNWSIFYENKQRKKKFKIWESGLYENSIYQMIHTIICLIPPQEFNNNEAHRKLGSFMYYCNFETKNTNGETILKNSQKQFIPFYLLTFKCNENKTCLVEKKKRSLNSQINKFQYYLLTKYEEFEKKFGIINNKLFFNFDLKLSKFTQCINEEVKISTFKIPLKRFLNHSFNKSSSNIFFLIMWTIISSCFRRTSSKLVIDLLYLIHRQSIEQFSKINSIFFLFKFFEKINVKFKKEIFGKFLENHLFFLKKNEKINFSRIFFSNSLSLDGICSVKKMNIKLSCLYLEYNFYEKYLQKTKKNNFLSNFLKIFNLSDPSKISNLCLRKQLNQKSGKKKPSFFIFLGEVGKDIKFFEINYLQYPRLRSLMKYLEGISMDQKIKFFYAKKQILLSTLLKPTNKESWFTFGCFSFRDGDLQASMKSFNKILTEESKSFHAKNNINLCLDYLIKLWQTNSIIFEKFLKNSRTSFIIILKIFYFFSSTKRFDIFFVISSIIDLFFLKEQLIKINFNVFKGSTLIFLDSLKRKRKISIGLKRENIYWIHRNLKLNLEHFNYKKICFQLNSDLRYFEKKIKNIIPGSFFNGNFAPFLISKKKNFSDFFFETGNKFLRNYS